MSSRPILPVSLYLADKAVLLVGDGPLADERRARLVAAGAAVGAVASASYSADMCDGVVLVVAMTDDRELDRKIAEDARSRGAMAYAHDQPAVSDLAMPAVVRRGPLTIAIATDGVAPALARRLREELDRLLSGAGPQLDRLIDAMRRARAEHLGAGRGEALYRMAARLRLTGTTVVDEPGGDHDGERGL